MLTLAILLVEAPSFRQGKPWRALRPSRRAPKPFSGSATRQQKDAAISDAPPSAKISSPRRERAGLKPLAQPARSQGLDA